MDSNIQLNVNKEIRSYLWGFILSLILTAVPFLLAILKILSNEFNSVFFLVCAISQIIVHFVFFLHLNFSTQESLWNIVTLLFIIMIILIIVFGSIWIMFNLNHHMLK